MSLSDYNRNAHVAWETRGTAMPAAPSGHYVQLHTGDPGRSGTANVAALSTRQAAAFAGTPASGSISNSADIVWNSGFAAETITHASVWDAATSGNCLRYGALNAPITTTASASSLTIAAGQLTFSDS